MAEVDVTPGRSNSLADVAGLRVGHRTQVGPDHLTGTTVIWGGPAGVTAAVDVRGGAPGTRETDLLSPLASMQRVTAIVLTGGSAFGLDSAGGAVAELADRGFGFPAGDAPGEVVPIVPAAVLFDLGRGGRFRSTPSAQSGRDACRAALDPAPTTAAEPTETAAAGSALPGVQHGAGPAGNVVAQGNVGAGTGAVIGGLKGGIGTASARLPGGATVAALLAVNAVGSPLHPVSGSLLGDWLLLPGDVRKLVAPSAREAAALLDVRAAAGRALLQREQQRGAAAATDYLARNTTIGVIATDVALDKAGCGKLAAIGHDGLARAINPVHTLLDGDTLFGVSTGARRLTGMAELQQILSAAANVVTRAVIRAVLAAESVTTQGGSWPGYSQLAPSATGP